MNTVRSCILAGSAFNDSASPTLTWYKKSGTVAGGFNV